MPRRPKINYYKSRGGYYTQRDKRQYPLAYGPDDYPDGPTYRAATQEFSRLFDTTVTEMKGDNYTIEVICNLFLTWAETRIQPSTMRAWLHVIRPFTRHYGTLQVGHLTHEKITEFLNRQRQPRPRQQKAGGKVFYRSWGDSSCELFRHVFGRILNWCVKEGILAKLPIRIKQEGIFISRSRACILTPADHQLILSHCRQPYLRHLCILLEATGARPSEILAAQACYWNEGRQAMFFPADSARQKGEFRHKTARYKNRWIYFSGEALLLIRELMQKYPKGPMFWTRKGVPCSIHTLCKRFRVISDKTGIKNLTPYTYRHTFATRWLESGKPIEILAELLGNSPNIIRRYYSHLCDRHDTLRAQLEHFRQTSCTASGAATEPAPPPESPALPEHHPERPGDQTP